jgi:protein-arginine kinase activator protein McsA
MHQEVGCEQCGYRYDADLGRYGCPDCHGEGMSQKKDPAAVSLGRRGGKAGTGDSKVRGDAAYYKRISKKAAAARKAKAAKRSG